MEKPEHGLATLVHYVKNYDGDTVTVEVRRQFDVRLRNINAPELNETGGKESKEALEKLLKQGSITLFIPAGKDLSLMDISSFTRIVGDVWVDDKNAQKEQVDSGNAKWVRGGIMTQKFSADEERIVKIRVPKNPPQYRCDDLYLSPDALQEIRNWGVDDIKEN